MAGIKLSENNSWLVANWVHEFTIELVNKYLPENASLELKAAIERDQRSGLNFISFERFGSPVLAEFRSALATVEEKLRDGVEPFADSKALPSYLERLGELVRLLREDPRSG